MRSARIIAGASGFRFASVKDGGLAARLGFRNGDVVRAVNGIALTTPEQALAAYAQLKSARRLAVTVERNGIPIELLYLLG